MSGTHTCPRCTNPHARNEPPALGWLLIRGQGGDVGLFSPLSPGLGTRKSETFFLTLGRSQPFWRRQQGFHTLVLVCHRPCHFTHPLSSAPHRLVTSGLSSPAQISLPDPRLGHRLYPRHLCMRQAGTSNLTRPKLISWFLPLTHPYSSCGQLKMLGPKALEVARTSDFSLSLPPQPNPAAKPAKCAFKIETGDDFLDLTPKA